MHLMNPMNLMQICRNWMTKEGMSASIIYISKVVYTFAERKLTNQRRLNFLTQSHQIHRNSLPSPFPLPRSFRPDVRVALESRKMTLETTGSFLSTIASAIAKFTLYPTKDDLSDVARAIIDQYPFMQASKGKLYVSTHANKTRCIMYTPFVGCTCRRIKKPDERVM